MPGTFIEQDCVIEHQGRKFESGGAYIGRHRKTGRLGGILYVIREESKPTYVGSWDAQMKVPARFGCSWTSGFGDTRQSVYFELEDKPFYGIWYKSGSEIVRCREVKKR